MTGQKLRVLNALGWACLIAMFLSIWFITLMTIRIQWMDGPFALSPATAAMPEADFADLWVAGQLARQHLAGIVYSAAGFEAARQHLFGPGFTRLDWLYPPTVFLLAAPVSLLPLLPGYFFWLAAMIGLSVIMLRQAGLSWFVIGFGMIGPATWRAYQLGQIVPLTGALLFAGLLSSKRRPVFGGVMLGFVTLKPQIGLLAPVALLAAQNWRALSSAAAIFMAMAFAAALFFGWNSWILFAEGASAHGRNVLEAMFPAGYPNWAGSVFWSARALGATLRLAYLLQTAAALAAVLVAWFYVRRLTDEPERAAILVCCLSLLASPYLYASDLVAYSISLALLAELRAAPLLLLAFLWLCPELSIVVTAMGAKPFLPFCAIIVAWLAIRNVPIRTMSDRGVGPE